MTKALEDKEKKHSNIKNNLKHGLINMVKKLKMRAEMEIKLTQAKEEVRKEVEDRMNMLMEVELHKVHKKLIKAELEIARR